LGTYNNEIEQFIYNICYHPMWEAAYSYIAEHPYALNLTYSKIQSPDSALLEDMILEFSKNIRINEDALLFDAVVSCTIILTEERISGTASHETSQWLIISCKAKVSDKLDSVAVTDISNYNPGKDKKKDGQAVSKNIVPILYKKDLDNEAEEFLKKYFPVALEKPTPVPISEIAEKMGLEIIQGNRITDDFSIFGEVYFTAGQAEVYDLFKISKNKIDVHRGTILVDAYTFWERNLGCVNNTIAHEVYHWYKHRMYAAIKYILYGKDFVACRCPSSMAYPSKSESWTDIQRMEWQANNMAPRILMPISTFRVKVNDLYQEYDYQNSELKPQVLTCIAEELAKFYGVSKQSVLIRMMEVGYKEASSIYQYNEKDKRHIYVSKSDAFYEYCANKEFRKLVDSGNFRYVDGYFVINDETFLHLDDNGIYTLTDYAWANLDECALKFAWQTLHPEDQRYLPFEIFHRKNTDKQISQYDASDNVTVLALSEDLLAKRNEFECEKGHAKLTSINKTCWELIYELIRERGMSKTHFCNATLLGEEVYRKAEKNITTNPELRTIVAIACGLDLDITTTEKLLQLAGHAFNDSDEHRALKFCITGLFGYSIEERNTFLESYGYKPLGSKERA